MRFLRSSLHCSLTNGKKKAGSRFKNGTFNTAAVHVGVSSPRPPRLRSPPVWDCPALALRAHDPRIGSPLQLHPANNDNVFHPPVCTSAPSPQPRSPSTHPPKQINGIIITASRKRLGQMNLAGRGAGTWDLTTDSILLINCQLALPK